MGIFSKKTRTCPVCGDAVPGDQDDVTGHVMTHMDDAVPGNPSGGLRLACGCENAVWPSDSNFPVEARMHLEDHHGMQR